MNLENVIIIGIASGIPTAAILFLFYWYVLRKKLNKRKAKKRKEMLEIREWIENAKKQNYSEQEIIDLLLNNKFKKKIILKSLKLNLSKDLNEYGKIKNISTNT